MAMRISGLASGMDTDSMVKELMSAHSLKKTNIEKKKTKLEWTQEKWKELNTKIYKLYTDQVSKMRLQGTYNVKSVSSSASDKVEASATGSAPTGSHTVSVQQLASSQYVTSGDIKSLGLTKNSKLSEIKDASGNSLIPINTVIDITSGQGDAQKVNQLVIDENTTVSNFVAALQNAGINATFDENQGRFFISSQKSGEENTFTITSSALTSEAVNARDNIKALVDYDSLSSSSQSELNKALMVLDKNSGASEKEITDAKVALSKVAESAAQAKTEKAAESFVSDMIKKQLEADDTIVADGDKTREEVIEEKLKEAMKKTENKDKVKYFTENGLNAQTLEDAKVAGTITEEDFANAAGYTEFISADEEKVIMKDAVALAAENYQTVETDGGENNVLSAIGLGNVTGAAVDGGLTGMTVVSAADSIITLNGAQLRSSTNSISANGINFTVKAVTKPATDTEAAETITLGVTNDVDGVYDSIKDFVKQYNELLDEMNKLYGADSARGYEPLSDEEKEQMSEKDIEKWETKVKDSLLRRDSTLDSVINGMRNALNSSIEVGGKRYSLSSFGITTSSDYTEKGLLHIYGDPDDNTYSGEEDKLKTALINEPEVVSKVLAGITSNLYSEMQNKMRSSSLSSAMTFYNDKQMKTQVKDYESSIKTWEEKLQDMEDKYFKQFAAMETAMQQMNSQSTYLTNLFGGS